MLFNKLRLLHPETPPVTSGLLGVMDMGSNAMDLVIYDVDQSHPGYYAVVDKVKIETAAGRVRRPQGSFSLGDEMTALLDDACNVMANRLAAHKPPHVVATATSVFRDAADGPVWCATQWQKRGWYINLIDGATEAKLSAIGALSNIDCRAGLVMDQGGGSLEVYDIATGCCGSHPFGVHSLMVQTQHSAALAARQMAEVYKKDLPWLAETKGDLVLVGRAMRLAGQHLLGGATQGRAAGREASLSLAKEWVAGRIDPALQAAKTGYEVRLPYRGAALQVLLEQAPQLTQVRFADYALREGIFITQTGQEKTK